jgi:outer membrane protein assembly factor BamB
MFESSAPALTLRSTAHPIVSEGLGIVGQPNGRLVAFDVQNGDRKWEQTLMIGRGRSELQRMVDINGDLAVANGILYATSYQGRIGAFDVASGRPFWQREMSSSTGVTLVNDRALAVADSEGIVWLLDSDTGATLWRQEGLKERILTRPAVVGDKLVVSDHQGFVHVLSLEDGKLIGREKLGKKPIYSPAIVDEENNEFFIYDSSGKLKAFQMG